MYLFNYIVFRSFNDGSTWVVVPLLPLTATNLGSIPEVGT